ncbi:molybdopterin-dependent oxidoreductase [Paracoccus sp. (in: a-proteobacteria)]|uniref:molybdopterin-dependent oxidoreductase n=1 Tax=Paracoccus sp. TaxID=267 RepID=UPI003A8966BA
MSMTRNFALTALLSALLFPLPLFAADPLPTPTGDVILTISGNITQTNVDGTAQFDLDMLKAMESKTIDTSTTWTDGVHHYTGVSLKSLLERVGAAGSAIEVTALNDYTISIPQDDWNSGDSIIAYLDDGQPMSIRDKGPLWIMYPFDDFKKYQTEAAYSRSVWQLDRIKVTD